MSPESMHLDKFEGKPCDIWSFGVTVYAYFYKKLPFNEINLYTLINSII
jgi:serine/threonine protein kinase